MGKVFERLKNVWYLFIIGLDKLSAIKKGIFLIDVVKFSLILPISFYFIYSLQK